MCCVAAGLFNVGVPRDLGSLHFMHASCTKVRDEKTVAQRLQGPSRKRWGASIRTNA